MNPKQLHFPEIESIQMRPYLATLISVIKSNLDFHNHDSDYTTHNFHSFPAKFPPQLPRAFIKALTVPGDYVLDPMQGSGTTIVEARMTGRYGIGFDIDPLSVIISRVKTTSYTKRELAETGNLIVQKATESILNKQDYLEQLLSHRWDKETRRFVDYWFMKETQLELMALLAEIENIKDPLKRYYFLLALSAIIITKSGGVSLALDLAHTRPHRAKVILSRYGEIIEGREFVEKKINNLKYATKTLRSPLVEFQKRVLSNLKGLPENAASLLPADNLLGDAQHLPLKDGCIDLIITSPPYASNAIDYMRAHKFSLVWLGHPLKELSALRNEYIGGEEILSQDLVPLPPHSQSVVSKISRLDYKKGQVLHRYYSEMARVIYEMYRVLKPGRAAILVVGNSQMRGQDTDTHNCLAEIGKSVGFDVPAIGVRNLDRNRRMLPAGAKIDNSSQIQQRMHQEYVIGFYKPNL